jgi:hypothetical protein
MPRRSPSVADRRPIDRQSTSEPERCEMLETLGSDPCGGVFAPTGLVARASRRAGLSPWPAHPATMSPRHTSRT